MPLPAAVIAEHERVLVRLEGWPEEVAEQTRAANAVAVLADADPTTWLEPAFPDAPILVQVAVVPSRLTSAVDGAERYRALLGVGYLWIACDDEGALARIRERVTSLGGIAPVIRGPGGLGATDAVSAALGARLKAAFDPANILAPGTF